MSLLDLIFPKYCVNCKKLGDYLCANCFSYLSYDTKNICLHCGKPSFDGLTHSGCRTRSIIEGSFTGVVFNAVSKRLIYSFKYKPYLSGMKSFVGDLFYESLVQNEEFMKVSLGDLVLVPIPLSREKLRKRGYNQAEILAKEIGKRFNFPVLNCLERIRNTSSQVKLSKKERAENVDGAFSFKKKFKDQIKKKNIVLVDDVLTSGATMNEACSVLKKAGVGKVWALAFAKED